MHDDLFIALDLAANAENPAQVPDIDSVRDSNGEYLFYAAADKAHGISQSDPEKLGPNRKIIFMVEVSFEEDIQRVAKAEIDVAKTRLSVKYGGYEHHREDVEMDGPGSFLDAFESNPVLLPIEAGENWASWIYGIQVGNSEPSLRVTYQAVEGDRTLSIYAYSQSDDFTLEEIIEHWQSLVDKYRDMPMRVFTGAPVV